MKRKHPKIKVKPLAAAMVAATAAQQTAQPQPRVFNRDQALLDAVIAQRNEALNAVATVNANFAVAQAAIHEQDAKIAELEAMVKALTPAEAVTT